jgi:hypothetical protein
MPLQVADNGTNNRLEISEATRAAATGCAVAGNPAQLVKKGVTWTFQLM